MEDPGVGGVDLAVAVDVAEDDHLLIHRGDGHVALRHTDRERSLLVLRDVLRPASLVVVVIGVIPRALHAYELIACGGIRAEDHREIASLDGAAEAVLVFHHVHVVLDAVFNVHGHRAGIHHQRDVAHSLVARVEGHGAKRHLVGAAGHAVAAVGAQQNAEQRIIVGSSGQGALAELNRAHARCRIKGAGAQIGDNALGRLGDAASVAHLQLNSADSRTSQSLDRSRGDRQKGRAAHADGLAAHRKLYGNSLGELDQRQDAVFRHGEPAVGDLDRNIRHNRRAVGHHVLIAVGRGDYLDALASMRLGHLLAANQEGHLPVALRDSLQVVFGILSRALLAHGEGASGVALGILQLLVVHGVELLAVHRKGMRAFSQIEVQLGLGRSRTSWREWKKREPARPCPSSRSRSRTCASRLRTKACRRRSP